MHSSFLPSKSRSSAEGFSSRRMISSLGMIPFSAAATKPAPTATASSGLTNPVFGSFPTLSTISFEMHFIRVAPPTRTTSRSSSFMMSPSAVSIPYKTSRNVRSISSRRCPVIFSKTSTSIVFRMVTAPQPSNLSIVTSISACSSVDRVIFASSAASLSSCIASGFRNICSKVLSSTPSSIQSSKHASKSSPPKKLFPEDFKTSKTSSPICNTDTSNVPPPRSNTSKNSSFSLPIP
mmetsp:Transcript_225/g.428  ORF Transcript_225/g.428 Transcript_225/m.428 type:complete len:236 (-) Transcript_225:285-992(-)